VTLSRRASRRTAFFLLYQWDVTGQPLASLYEGEVDEFARDTAEAVAARVEELDRRITAASDGWTADRLGAVERNILRLATYELRSEMNITGSDHPEDISEADIAGLAMVPSRVVKPPRVERSPIALECIYNKTIDLVCSNGKKTVNSLVIGEVVNVHIDDSVIVDGNIDMARIRPIARLGYMDYTSVDNIFTMHRVPVR